MGKKGYPDGSVGIVVPWGDEYAPGQPAIMSSKRIHLFNRDIFNLLFEMDSQPEVEAKTLLQLYEETGNSGFKEIADIHGNQPVLEIKDKVTLHPKYLQDVLVLTVVVYQSGKVTISGMGGLSTNYAPAWSSIGGTTKKINSITIEPPVYLVWIDMYALLDKQYPLILTSNINTPVSIDLPPGEYTINVDAHGSFSPGSTLKIELNGITIAQATYNMGSGYYFKDQLFRINVDNPSTLKFTSSQTLTLTELGITVYQTTDPSYANPKASTYTASETSTTASTTTAMSDVKPHRFRNISVQVSIASGGGSVKVLMNGNAVAEYTSSGTYTLPDFENITKLAFEVAGDGTNASSVTFNAIEEVKDLIVASLL